MKKISKEDFLKLESGAVFSFEDDGEIFGLYKLQNFGNNAIKYMVLARRRGTSKVGDIITTNLSEWVDWDAKFYVYEEEDLEILVEALKPKEEW